MRKTAILLLLAIFVSGISFSASATTRRKAAVAGTFYPADSTELRAMVREHLDRVKDSPQIDGRIIAIVVPHAGLIYSGAIAAHSYKLLEGSGIDKVILCGPSHQYRFEGVSVYGPNIAWTNPLGTVNCLGRHALQMMKTDDAIIFDSKPHIREHSLEVQLPYLQTVLDDFKILPAVMGRQDQKAISLLTDALKAIDFDEKTIMVASTDLQHYRSAEQGWPMDSLIISYVENLDPVRLQMSMRQQTIEMCGGGPLIAVMKAAIAQGADKVKILKYGDSGDHSGDKSSVVGYLAAVIYQSTASLNRAKKAKLSGDKKEPQEATGPKETKKELPKQFKLDAFEKKELLGIARRAIASYLKNGQVPEFEVSDNLNKFGAAFVTLELRDRLRGCIGHTSAVAPLYKTVSSCAIQAAVGDRRFPPVTKQELERIRIEISVLSPMQKVDNWKEIIVGRDGLMIFKGDYRGLLLPQVATDNGWNRITFLEQTCQKAGLPIESYKHPETVIYKFQAVVFRE